MKSLIDKIYSNIGRKVILGMAALTGFMPVTGFASNNQEEKEPQGTEQVGPGTYFDTPMSKPDFEQLKRQDALAKSTGTQQYDTPYHRALMNPFGTPINTTIYYGSGNADGIETGNIFTAVDSVDYQLMQNETQNMMTDVDADATQTGTSDIALVEGYANGSHEYLPSWWEYLQTEEERTTRSDNIVKNVDNLEENPYISDYYISGTFGTEDHMRAMGCPVSFSEVPAQYDTTKIGRYNYPKYIVGIWKKDDPTWAHGMSATPIGDSLTVLSNWSLNECRTDSTNVPLGEWYTPYNSEVWMFAIDYFIPGKSTGIPNPLYLFGFNIDENGNDSWLYDHPDLILERPAIPRNKSLSMLEERVLEVPKPDMVWHYRDTKNFRVLEHTSNVNASFDDSSLVISGLENYFGPASVAWIVSDPYSSDTGYVGVDIENTRDDPVAVVADTNVSQKGTFELDASKSYHPDAPLNDIESYRWEQVAGPDASIANPDSSVASFNLQERGIYDFELTVADSLGYTGKDTLTLNASTLDINNYEVPSAYRLEQNYPNPFNPITTIKYYLPISEQMSLKVYDLKGNELETLVEGIQPQGNHEVSFDASKHSSGIYFYRLQTENGFNKTRKMLTVK